MKCPKCEEGNIIKIVFKKNGEHGSLCDLCKALWLEGEKISPDSAHKFLSYSNELDREHALEEFDQEDQDHSPINYTTFK